MKILVFCFLFYFVGISMVFGEVKNKQQPSEFTFTNLPIIAIDTYNKKIVDEPKIDAHIGIIWNASNVNYISDVYNDYEGEIAIELRGNSSMTWEKKPYLFETRNDKGENKNVSLIGLPAENDWVLHAPYVDKTLMRNALLYRVLNELGWYAPHYQFCELFINDNYEGVYVLVESLKIDKNRLDIGKPKADDVRGGYLLELTTSGRLGNGEEYIQTTLAKQVIAIASPSGSELTAAHKKYIGDYFNEFEEAISKKQFQGANDYKNLINVSSFIDHLLISEVFRQLDVFCGSHYFNKDFNGKLTMGPGWDFNRSMGNYAGHNSWQTSGLWLLESRGGCKPFWSMYFYEDPYFMNQYKARYKELRKTILSLNHLYTIIDTYATFLEEAQKRNFERWPVLNLNKSHHAVAGSYSGEVEYMKDWLETRFTWLDKEWGVENIPVINEFYADGTDTNQQWIELYNPYNGSINISGWKIKLDNSTTYTFPSNTTIKAKDFVVVCVNKNTFNAYKSKPKTVIEGLNFNFRRNSFSLKLLKANSTVVDSVLVNISLGWPPVEKSGNFSVGLNPLSMDHGLGTNWNWSENENGTPGYQNVNYAYKGLMFTEVQSSNEKTLADENGEYNDWIELYNNSNHVINLAGLFLTDERKEPWKYQIPYDNISERNIIEPNTCVIIWANDDSIGQPMHAPFQLKSSGERIAISYYNGFSYEIIDSVSVDKLNKDMTYMLADNQSRWYVSNDPTPGEYDIIPLANDPVFPQKKFISKVYPNPSNGYFTIDFQLSESQKVDVFVTNINGQLIGSEICSGELHAGHYSFSSTIQRKGIFMVHIVGETNKSTQRLIVY